LQAAQSLLSKTRLWVRAQPNSYIFNRLATRLFAFAIKQTCSENKSLSLLWTAITSSGKDVLVLGNALVQFQSPLSVMPDSGYSTQELNLLDDNSFALVQEILKLAGAK
jgi:hypothetical protein